MIDQEVEGQRRQQGTTTNALSNFMRTNLSLLSNRLQLTIESLPQLCVDDCNWPVSNADVLILEALSKNIIVWHGTNGALQGTDGTSHSGTLCCSPMRANSTSHLLTGAYEFGDEMASDITRNVFFSQIDLEAAQLWCGQALAHIIAQNS